MNLNCSTKERGLWVFSCYILSGTFNCQPEKQRVNTSLSGSNLFVCWKVAYKQKHEAEKGLSDYAHMKEPPEVRHAMEVNRHQSNVSKPTLLEKKKERNEQIWDYLVEINPLQHYIHKGLMFLFELLWRLSLNPCWTLLHCEMFHALENLLWIKQVWILWPVRLSAFTELLDLMGKFRASIPE